MEVNVNEEEIKPYLRHDSVLLGLTRAVQCLAHVVCLEASNREPLEAMLKEQRDKEDVGLKEVNIKLYKSTIQGVLEVIEQLKNQEAAR
jgi:hypothetical protein